MIRRVFIYNHRGMKPRADLRRLPVHRLPMPVASGLCGKFGTRLFTAMVVRARRKNAGIAGPASTPCFGQQQANAAMATVASSRVTELSKRPTSGPKLFAQEIFGLQRGSRFRDVICLFTRAARLVVPAALFALTSNTAVSGSLNFHILDEENRPVPNAIIALKPVQSDDATSTSTGAGKVVTIAQENGQFDPLVTVVQTGTAIAFPNNDNVHHNVYSISRAKRFQLPLYKDQAPDPIVFDTPGSVVLGCNIHDWMVAYVKVVDSPHFAKTDENGRVEVDELSDIEYEVEVWHPRKRRRQKTTIPNIMKPQSADPVTITIAMTPQWRSGSDARAKDEGQ